MDALPGGGGDLQFEVLELLRDVAAQAHRAEQVLADAVDCLSG